jgi:hypothetical protein
MSVNCRLPRVACDRETFGDAVTAGRVERLAGQGRDDLDLTETGGQRLRFRPTHDRPPDSLSGEIRVHEKRANHCGFRGGVAQRVFVLPPTVPAVERLAPAPTSAADDAVLRLGHEVRSVPDELRVDAKNRPDRAIELCVGVISFLEHARGQRYELLQRGHVRNSRNTQFVPAAGLKVGHFSLMATVRTLGRKNANGAQRAAKRRLILSCASGGSHRT